MPELHSKVVGGSTASRVLACPASVDLVAKVPPAPSSSYANKGTALHSAMEWLLDPTVRRRRDPMDLLGMTMNKIKIDKAMIDDFVVPALEYFRSIDLPGYQLEITSEFPGIAGAFGTTDVSGVRKDGTTLVIFDWKFGEGVKVSAIDNNQLRFYACCVLTLKGLWRSVENVEMHICQPKTTHGPNNSHEIISIRELRMFRHQLIRTVNGPRTRMETGDHCRWCAAAPFCPAKKEEAKAALAWTGAEVGQSLAEMMELAVKLKDFHATVSAAVKTCLTKNGKVPGWKMVDGRNTRKWAIDDPAVRRYLSSHGLTEDQFAPRSLVTAPAAETLLKTKGAKLDTSKITVEGGAPTLAPESDPRGAVSLGRDLNDLAALLKR